MCNKDTLLRAMQIMVWMRQKISPGLSVPKLEQISKPMYEMANNKDNQLNICTVSHIHMLMAYTRKRTHTMLGRFV